MVVSSDWLLPFFYVPCEKINAASVLNQ